MPEIISRYFSKKFPSALFYFTDAIYTNGKKLFFRFVYRNKNNL